MKRCTMVTVLAAAMLAAATMSTAGAFPRAHDEASAQSDAGRVSGGTPDLSGIWTWDTSRAPAHGPIVRESPCYGAGAQFIVVQHGSDLEVAVVAAEMPSGVVRVPSAAAADHVRGTLRGDRVVLTGTRDASSTHVPTTYDLRFDAHRALLVGTHDGRPFWAARVVTLPRTHACPPPPP